MNEITFRIKALKLVDRDLRLNFSGTKQVTSPDDELTAYFFDMVNTHTRQTMGQINIKAGYTENIIHYRGNIGFSVFEDFRGRRYSSRSCLLLFPVFNILKLDPVWITCSANNIASRKNIESIGAKYIDTLEVPEKYFQYYPKDARVKMRYKLIINS